MKVLFLSQRVPWPPDRGDRITTWHYLRHLLDRGARVRLGCFSEEERDAASVDHLRGMLEDVCAPRLDRRLARLLSLRGLLTGEPLSLPFFRHRGLRRAVDRWLRQDPPDLVYVYTACMAQYVLAAEGPVRVMQFAELDSDRWRQHAEAGGRLLRLVYGREARKLLAFERRVARAFDRSFVVSDTERELFERSIPGVVPAVLPNGVDVEHFRSAGEDRREAHTVVFTGVMDYPPNVDGVTWFAEACWPAVRARFPDARWRIVGSRPVEEVRALARRSESGIEVTGRVPETPPWFDRAAVAIAPLRLARGVQNKVLEALSMAVPVVATPQAVQGLGPEPEGVRIAADEGAMAASVCELLGDPPAARELGRRGADWVRRHFRWEHMYARLDRELAALGLPAPGPVTAAGTPPARG